jgi:hypothetical protein
MYPHGRVALSVQDLGDKRDVAEIDSMPAPFPSMLEMKVNPFVPVCLSWSVKCGGCFFAQMGWVKTPQT